MRFPRRTVLALSLAAATLPTWADDKKDPPVKAEDKDPPGTAEETEALPETAAAAAEFDLAQKLIEYGRAKKDPSSLVTAALILHRNPTEDIEGLPEEAKKAALPAPKELLAEARKLRPDDKGAAAVLDWAEAELKVKERGAVGGSKTFFGGKTLTVAIPFRAGEAASITVTAVGQRPPPVVGLTPGKPGTIPGKPPVVVSPLPSGLNPVVPQPVTITVVGPGAPKAKSGVGTVGLSFKVPTSTTVKKGMPVTYKVTVTVTNGINPTFRVTTN